MYKYYVPDHQFFDSVFTRLMFKLKKFFYYLPYWRLSFIFCFGAYLGFERSSSVKNKRFLCVNLWLVGIYSLTLIISGQFFRYHFMTIFFFSFFFIANLFEQTDKKNLQVFCIVISLSFQLPFSSRSDPCVEWRKTLHWY